MSQGLTTARAVTALQLEKNGMFSSKGHIFNHKNQNMLFLHIYEHTLLQKESLHLKSSFLTTNTWPVRRHTSDE